ncbi:MAG: 50S ribosomal protein L18 [Gammaproteobacteria bacterium]|nr:50S ribosomal protein L18 [Gammaproteobacteria bacterium]MCH9764126.1 50S ribosomal protein L18 [Gammaproteobacteria bacterium]
MATKERARIRRGSKTKAVICRSGRPRLVVYRSASQIYAQIVVPTEKGDRVLVSCSSLERDARKTIKGNKVERAFQVGQLLGQRAKALDLVEVAFDRSGYKYHGRVKALADGAREALTF